MSSVAMPLLLVSVDLTVAVVSQSFNDDVTASYSGVVSICGC
jgi:hypothetical protein